MFIINGIKISIIGKLYFIYFVNEMFNCVVIILFGGLLISVFILLIFVL